ncbi:MAG: ferritin family protein [Acidaminococcaceae bacterium]
MPSFGNPFEGLAANRKLSEAELTRAIRFLVAAEYEAVQLYVQLAESTDNELAKVVLNDIADEEKVHAGEFLALLKALAPDEDSFYKQGEAEVEELKQSLSTGETAKKEGTAADEETSFTVGSLVK